MSGSSTPVLDEIPPGPVSVSVQDIFDGIVLETSQLNRLLSVGEEISVDDVESESEESPDVSEKERESLVSQKGREKRGVLASLVRLSQLLP